MKEILRAMNRQQVEKIEPGVEISYEEASEYIKNPDSFAKRIPDRESMPHPGVTLTEKSIDLGEGFFTNMYDLSFPIHNNDLDANVLTFTHPTYQHRLFSKESAMAAQGLDIVATINGAFFYLQDDISLSGPKEIMYNLNIRNGKIVGLPAATRPALMTNKEGDLRAVEIEAHGELLCGNTRIEWKGAEPFAHGREPYTRKDDQAYLFNPACCAIHYSDPKDKRSLRILQREKNKTPVGPDYIDVIVTLHEADDSLRVSSIQEGGGTDFFNGNFILQGNRALFQNVTIGDTIDVKSISGYSPSDIASAMTVGPMVQHFLENEDHEINHDPSLGTFPPFAQNERYARSIIYADKNGGAHFVVFDAVPRSAHMKGVTPREAATLIPQDASWAVFLDGGQSSKITFRDENIGTTDSRGNEQYIRLHKNAKSGQSILAEGKEDQFLWSKRGREVPSVVALTKKR